MAMIVLVILTLLGVAALRASRLELRLAHNAQSRLSALQQAQSVADAVAGDSSNLPILPGTGYFWCYSAAAPYAPAHPPSPPFGAGGGCADYQIGSTSYRYTGTIVLPSVTSPGVSSPLPRFAYAQALRNAPEFLGPAAVRGAETSGRAYDFASFSVTGGYDSSDPQSATRPASQPGGGAAEVVEGFYLRHSRATGVNYQ